MNGADILVEMLVRYGVNDLFGVPGDTNVSLYSALQRRVGEIRHIMCRDERSAGYMADAYARISNKVGVFEAPSGAGAMYSLPPVAEANSSSVAMILLTIDIPLSGEGRGVITELDCKTLFEPITKASIQIKSTDKIPETVRRAFRIATSGTPGAVHLVIPEDILDHEASIAPEAIYAEDECSSFPSFATAPSQDAVQRLVALLGESSRPVIVAGGGCNRGKAGDALLRFVEKTNIPVVTSITGQGVLPDDHKLAIGVIGDNGFHPHANRALEESDLILYIGSKVGSVVTVGWSLPKKNVERKIVQIDSDPNVLANTAHNDLSICSDARLALEALVDAFDEQKARDYTSWVQTINVWRGAFWDASMKFSADTTSPLKPEVVVSVLNNSRLFPANVLSDAGTPTPYMTRFFKIIDGQSTFIIPRAFGGLGYAIPAVVGAWVADPDKRPIGLFGDGSFNMSVGELETLVRLQVPALLLHFNNACFGWIKGLHRMQGRGTNDCYSVDFSRGDAAAIADAFGIKSFKVETAEEFRDAIIYAEKHKDGPIFIDIVIESLAERVPPVFSWLRKQGADPLSNDTMNREFN
ncbi:thiamine pyrophosphate-binding protein (plasmid) [Agrobacterium leguminum]|uniref:Thiamine pyrophosphate protein central region n=1 Tax=Agrobacterium deltaense NCPPB 1641 TaxID=1183425 RepID=A0A1S7U9G7_9HYPH|nr:MULTISPECIES: thiamine pyrophosphate-binding protein [Agrobacterium]WFS70112.1 thiamine pyrophosphate-binding protein [Agrobacterium leguminum]CVI63546.1 Thiamine pyrophosphate protein central region [Agrobacterium deltaense NCPPB 1641]